MSVLTTKPGIYGMIGGQVADVELTGSRLSEEQLTYIYENKTGALIEASMLIGAILAGAKDEELEKVFRIASNVGMAFQIQADILDETATFEELGNALFGSYQESDRRSIMVNVSRLRKKMTLDFELENMIETVWSKGYRFIVK